MTVEEKTRPLRYQYHMPTKIYVEDKLLNLGPISLTLRQGFVLTLGGCVSLNVWRWLSGVSLLGTVGLSVQIVCTAFPLLLTLLIAVVRVADRDLEDWFLVLARYWSLPKYYCWRHLPSSLRTCVSQSGRGQQAVLIEIEGEGEVGEVR